MENKMKTILDFFKGMVDWVLTRMKNEGTQRTVTAILLVVLIFVALAGHENNIVRRFEQGLHQQSVESTKEHQDLYLASRDMYAQIKRVMRGERPITRADYILFIEYHNGSENISTGYQFCKFDVTIEELSDTVPYIQIDDFKDENLYKYDILLSDRVTKSKMSAFTLEEVKGLDRNLLYTLNPNEHTQYIVFYNIMYNHIPAGTLMFLYKDESLVDYTAIATCGSDIESIIHDAIDKHNIYKSSKSSKK
jgi:hypothetical protein